MLDGYDVVVADFRYKNSGDHVTHIARRLKPGGLFVLASIDDVDSVDGPVGSKHASYALNGRFVRIETVPGSPTRFAHMHTQTRNKCQYAISHLSVWRKLASQNQSVQLYDVPVEASGEATQSTADYYEDDSILSSYDRFHFGAGFLSVENFPLRMSEICLEACKRFGIGCEAGNSPHSVLCNVLLLLVTTFVVGNNPFHIVQLLYDITFLNLIIFCSIK
jgi:hypothetical protein